MFRREQAVPQIRKQIGLRILLSCVKLKFGCSNVESLTGFVYISKNRIHSIQEKQIIF